MPSRKNTDSNALLEDIRKTMKINIVSFRENQEETINALLDGKDAFIVMPTGSGKSICFQYPALKKKGITIVIEPIIALMEDQTEKLTKAGIKVKYIKHLPKSESEISALLDNENKIFYISPENFLSPKFICAAKKADISMLVIDEAHCVSVWGNGFRPRYLKIEKAFRMIGKHPQTVAFTATAGDFIREQVKIVLGMKNNVFEILPKDPGSLYRRDNVELIIKNISGYTRNTKNNLSSSSAFQFKDLTVLKNIYLNCFKDIIEKDGSLTPVKKDRAASLSEKYYISIAERWFAEAEQLRELTGLIRTKDPDDPSGRKEQILIRSRIENIKYKAADEFENIYSGLSSADRDIQLAEDLKHKYEILKKDIISSDENGAIIVYCSAPSSAELLYEKLSDDKQLKELKIAVHYYHGALDAYQRKKQQNAFMKNKKRQVMVATSAFGMGIDKDNVRLVIFYEVPRSIEDYFQGIGRAGRDGKPSVSMVYSYLPDIKKMRDMTASYYDKKTDRFYNIADDNGISSAAMDMYDRAEQSILTDIARYRFMKFEQYLRQRSDGLSRYIVNYFLYDRFDDMPDKSYYKKGEPPIDLSRERIELANELVKKRIGQIGSLYIASCKPAFDIRNGKCRPDVPYYDSKNKITVTIGDEIDFLDLMLANAVYTLGFNGITSISVKKLFRLLTGDDAAAPEPAVREELYSRILKLMKTDIEILSEDDSFPPVRGKFLALSVKTDRIFNYEGDPPICRYAITDGYKFITIDLKWLRIAAGKNGSSGDPVKAVDDTLNNMLIKLYMAWRIAMLAPSSEISPRKYDANEIRYYHYDKRRAAVFEIAGIERTADSDIVIQHILEYYIQLGIIKGYRYITDKNNDIVKLNIIPAADRNANN